MHRTTTAPAPLNLITTWLMWLIEVCKVCVFSEKGLRQNKILLKSITGSDSKEETPEFDADDAFTAR